MFSCKMKFPRAGHLSSSGCKWERFSQVSSWEWLVNRPKLELLRNILVWTPATGDFVLLAVDTWLLQLSTTAPPPNQNEYQQEMRWRSTYMSLCGPIQEFPWGPWMPGRICWVVGEGVHTWHHNILTNVRPWWSFSFMVTEAVDEASSLKGRNLKAKILGKIIWGLRLIRFRVPAQWLAYVISMLG